MPRAVWKVIDTRQLGENRDCIFDGFVHMVPWQYSGLHILSLKCWCEPRAVWTADNSLLVSHVNRRPQRQEEAACPE